MDIDIFIVAFHAKEALYETAVSIMMSSDPGYRLTIYDNSVKNYPLTWLWNRFVEQSGREYIAMCNPDIIVSPRWDTEAKACFDQHPDVAAVNPHTNYGFQQGMYGNPWPPGFSAFDSAKIADKMKSDFKDKRFTLTKDSRILAGHCYIFKKSTWKKIGGFDERITFFFNEVDFSRRAIQAGMSIAVCGHAFAFHKWHSSTQDAKKLGVIDDKGVPKFNAPPPVKFSQI